VSKQKIFYKVVQKDHKGNWQSAFVEGKLSLTYSVNEWTYPVIKKSRIFVFQDADYAFAFGRTIRLNPVIVFECLVKSPKEMIYVCNTYCGLSVEDAEKFWRSRKLNNSDVSISPPGSFSASAVKLLKIYGT